MKTTIKKRLIIGITALLLLAGSAQAQSITLTGKIVEDDTGKPLCDAMVEVGDVITYTNSEGAFALQVPAAIADELQVMHMGYDVRMEKISETPYSLALTPVAPEKNIERFGSGAEVMRQVFLRIHYNYEIDDQLMLAYYKESLSVRGRIQHFGEGILEVHIPSDVGKGDPLVRPIKTRVKTVDKMKHGGLYDKSGHASDMIQAGVLAFHTFLSEKNRWDYEYDMIGKEVHRNEDIYIVDFQPEGKKGSVKGRLWIDALSFAVIRIEYQPVYETLWDSELWVEEFQHHNHTYYLMRASFEGNWHEEGIPYVFNSLVVNTQIEANKKYISWEKFIPGRQFSFLEDSHGDFSDEFWGRYNHVLLTGEEQRQLVQK